MSRQAVSPGTGAQQSRAGRHGQQGPSACPVSLRLIRPFSAAGWLCLIQVAPSACTGHAHRSLWQARGCIAGPPPRLHVQHACRPSWRRWGSLPAMGICFLGCEQYSAPSCAGACAREDDFSSSDATAMPPAGSRSLQDASEAPPLCWSMPWTGCPQVGAWGSCGRGALLPLIGVEYPSRPCLEPFWARRTLVIPVCLGHQAHKAFFSRPPASPPAWCIRTSRAVRVRGRCRQCLRMAVEASGRAVDAS